MFFLRYLKGELIHRPGKTVTVSLGLAMASAIIITIVSISHSLSVAQDTVLDPLASVGTDILVTRSVDQENISQLDDATREEALASNRISTDFAELGDPGEHFATDSFLLGDKLTFDQSVSDDVESSVVAATATGLMLNVTHQEGTIPDLYAEVETGGQSVGFERIFELSDTDRQAMMDAQREAMDALREQGINPNSEEGRAFLEENVPRPSQTISGTVDIPRETIRQGIGSFSTDVQSESFTLAGVDTSKTDIGLILPDQITDGRYLEQSGDIIVTAAYAQKKNYSLGGTITIGDRDLTFVGVIDPKLYTLQADAYVSLDDAQALSDREGRVNVLLVKAVDADAVDAAGAAVATLFSGASVSDASETADQVSGSLVSASNLTNKFIGITSIVVIAAALAIVSLITVFSVNKRVRELGTLKAIGWSNRAIIRQIILENVIVGLIGAALGIGLGIAGLALVNTFDISLSATFAGAADESLGMMRRFFGSEQTTTDVTTSIPLHVVMSWTVLAIGAGVALLGAVFASAFASLKSARMKPQEALRDIE